MYIRVGNVIKFIKASLPPTYLASKKINFISNSQHVSFLPDAEIKTIQYKIILTYCANHLWRFSLLLHLNFLEPTVSECIASLVDKCCQSKDDS